MGRFSGRSANSGYPRSCLRGFHRHHESSRDVRAGRTRSSQDRAAPYPDAAAGPGPHPCACIWIEPIGIVHAAVPLSPKGEFWSSLNRSGSQHVTGHWEPFPFPLAFFDPPFPPSLLTIELTGTSIPNVPFHTRLYCNALLNSSCVVGAEPTSTCVFTQVTPPMKLIPAGKFHFFCIPVQPVRFSLSPKKGR
jgi:hypothetical protein